MPVPAKQTIHVGITDDHQLFVKSLSLLIGTFASCSVVIEAASGYDLLKKMAIAAIRPDILLLDVNMPEMDGATTARQIAKTYPNISIVALSMKDDDTTIINMIKAGCCAYLIKDTHPFELEKALHEIYATGHYNADISNINYRRLITRAGEQANIHITEREKRFLHLACTDMTYRQIATEMNLAERTIDGYREALFQKFNVQSRVGMALEAIRRNYVPL